MAKESNQKYKNAYGQIMLEIFNSNYKQGSTGFLFSQDEIQKAFAHLNPEIPMNFRDVLDCFSNDQPLPDEIIATAPKGYEWAITCGKNDFYEFNLVQISEIAPRMNLLEIKIPDETPSLVRKYALTDDQVLLANIRYNKIIDLFLQISSYSLQNHLQAKIPETGQVEIDEVYVGVNKFGKKFIVPVQTNSGNEELDIAKTMQGIAFCQRKFPAFICIPVSVQFVSKDNIAIFRLGIMEHKLKIFDEQHYRLFKDF